MINEVQKVSDGSMVFTSRRSFDCEVINKDGVGRDVTVYEGQEFKVSCLLYDDVNDTYNFEFVNGDKMECVPGSYIG